MNVVLTGGGGLLGTAMHAALAARGVTTTVLGRNDLSVERPEDIAAAILPMAPRMIINCAAHTDLDAAERDPSLDWAANARLPEILSNLAKQTGALLIHFSSTGCYGDWKVGPYTEQDPLHPTTAHHRAKRDGEKAIVDNCCDYLIFRTGWLFGGPPNQPKNFVWKRLLEARTTVAMQSDAIQQGCPSFVDDVASHALMVAETKNRGIFNLTGHGAASRFEYISKIVEFSGLPCTITPGPAFERHAPVSKNETSLNAALRALDLDHMGAWQIALKGYILQLMKSPQWVALERARRAASAKQAQS